MTTENFTNLLNDLYDKYIHSRKSDVAYIVENFKGEEFNAIKTFFFKYNYRSHPKFDKNAGSDEYIKNLIHLYEKGERVTEIVPEAPIVEETELSKLQKEITKAKGFLESIKKSTSEEVSKITLLVNNFNEDYSKKMEELSSMAKSEPIIITENPIPLSQEEKKSNTHIELRINMDFEASDIEIPKDIDNMPAGSRFLIMGQDGKPHAFEIVEVFYDYISMKDKCIKEISIKRV